MFPPLDSPTTKKTAPLQPTDFFGAATKIEDPFGKVTTKEIQGKGIFSSDDYKNVTGATPFGDIDDLTKSNINNQSRSEVFGNMLTQFGANLVSSLGQGLANTFDLVSNYKTIKGELTGSNDDFNSNLFGLSTKQMQDWANGITKRNEILRENPDEFNPADPRWWATQFASAGTGVGMALEALATTAAIEYTTGGMGLSFL